MQAFHFAQSDLLSQEHDDAADHPNGLCRPKFAGLFFWNFVG